MMGGIGKWFRHLVTGMVQGCLILAITAAVVASVATMVATHQLPSGWVLALIGAIVITAGLLGAVATLAWRLSHIGELVHVVGEISEHEMRKPEGI